MNLDPEFPGGEVLDTGQDRVEIGDPALEALPGGDVEEGADRLTLRPQNRRLLVQEIVRAALAFSLLLLTALVVVLAFTKVGSRAWADTKEFLDVALPALIALLGSAMGFYFGSRN